MSNLILYKSECFQGIECDLWKNENDEIFMTGEQLGIVLGYSHPRKAINKIALRNLYLLNEEFSTGTKMVSPSGFQETRIFNEDGIYEITMLAKTEKAKEFRYWVRNILKGIRKGEIEVLQKQIIEIQPKLELYNQCIEANNYMTMLQISKILKTSRNKLFAFLRQENILMNKNERHNVPYQQYIDRKLFAVVIKSVFKNNQIYKKYVVYLSQSNHPNSINLDNYRI